MNTTLYAVGISLVPFLIVWVAISFTFIKFTKPIISFIQSIATGFILASIMIDLMPRVLQPSLHFSSIISFIIGFVVMLTLQTNEGNCCGNAKTPKALNSFLFPFAIEFLVTGILLGLAAVTNTILVILIAISFALCNLVCALSISSRLSQYNISRIHRTSITFLLTILFPIGALLSLVLIELFPEAISINKRQSVLGVFCAMTFVFLLYYWIY